jgi:hypothetical protein
MSRVIENSARFESSPQKRICRAASERRESPQFTGKVIAALYGSDSMMDLSGRALIGAELGAILGVTDVDGSLPRSYRDQMGGPPELHKTRIT